VVGAVGLTKGASIVGWIVVGAVELREGANVVGSIVVGAVVLKDDAMGLNEVASVHGAVGLTKALA
jgi:mannose/fructose/N-acetylgalactosamine-specific phosphotransferase system component IID